MDRVDEMCDRCERPIRIMVSAFEQAMESGSPLLCSECEALLIKAQEKANEPSKKCFEYLINDLDSVSFNEIGAEGWELVSVNNGIVYFKREYLEKGN